MRKRWQIVTGAALALCAVGLAHPASAEDFFSRRFGAIGGRPPGPSRIALPVGNDGSQPIEVPRPRVAYGGGQAWCVRTCDGRYFPITGSDAQSRTASCD